MKLISVMNSDSRVEFRDAPWTFESVWILNLIYPTV